ncbi:TPA: hypothetical protein EYP44_04365, partial [Candidatus Bathyarchaeota archaeon]|nr:hypothetical protein [Candidatus Bathyarchaeota archaeon]
MRSPIRPPSEGGETGLEELVEKSIYVIREARAQFKNPAVLWSTGKDSTTTLNLIKEAFFGEVPWDVLFLDTGFHCKEMRDFRDKVAKEWRLKLKPVRSDWYGKVSPFTTTRFDCCTRLKTEALKKAIRVNKYDAIVVSIRRDEHGIRGKERYMCFPPGTLVYGACVKPIENVRVGDLVASHDGALNKVKATSKRPYRGKLTVLNLEYSLPIYLTPAHPVLVKTVEGTGETLVSHLPGCEGLEYELRRPRVRWLPAAKIRRGDFVFVPNIPRLSCDGQHKLEKIFLRPIIKEPNLVRIERGRGVYLAYKGSHKDAPKLLDTVWLTPDVLRMMGYYIAEGSVSKKANQLSFSLHEDERDIIEDIFVTFERVWGLGGKIRQVSEKGVEILFSTKALSRFFARLCGDGARNKHLPSFFMSL